MSVFIRQKAYQENYMNVTKKYNDCGWAWISFRNPAPDIVDIILSWDYDLPPEYPDVSEFDIPHYVLLKTDMDPFRRQQ